MATLQPRQSYIDHFINGLKACTTIEDIQQGKRIQKVFDTLQDAFSQTLAAVEGRFGRYLKQIIGMEDDNTLLMKAKKSILTSEKSKPNLNIQRKNRKSNLQVHSVALKNCFQKFIEVIDLQTTTVLDELVAEGVISVPDDESVRGLGSRRRQNEELLACLVGRLTMDDFHRVFLPALNTHYPSVVEALIAEMDRLETEFEENLCVACRVRRDVQVKRIASALLNKKHISYAMYSDLRSAGMTNSTKWAELKSLPHTAIIDALKVNYPDFYKELKALHDQSLECRCLETRSDIETTEDSKDCCTSSISQSDIDVDILEVFSPPVSAKTAYKMTARPRGICLIMNNTVVKGHISRHWSNKDQEKLQRVFTKLEFLVVTKTNLTAAEMIATANKFAKMDHQKFDAFVCCITTFGTDQGLYGIDGKVFIDSELTSPFKASLCPSLAGKPKMFFIQASRKQFGQTKPVRGPGYVSDDADFLFGYSSFPFTESYAKKNGSEFISALTEILDKHSDHYDLLTCMRMVNHEVSRDKYFVGRVGSWREQVPAPVFTLTKDVFLNSSPSCPY